MSHHRFNVVVYKNNEYSNGFAAVIESVQKVVRVKHPVFLYVTHIDGNTCAKAYSGVHTVLEDPSFAHDSPYCLRLLT